MRTFFIHIWGLCIVVFSISAMEMNSNERVPEPSENFHITVIDIDDMPFDGTQVSFNGQTYIKGNRGTAEVYVPFERIDRMETLNRMGEKVEVKLFLINGESYTITCESDDEFTGHTSFGEFRLSLQHIKRAVFEEKIDPTVTPG